MLTFLTVSQHAKIFTKALKCLKSVGIGSVQRSSEHLRTFSGNIRKPSENWRKSLEVAGTFSEITVMTRQNSHAFDPQKSWQVYKSA